jgi:hypothetical protein
MKKKTIKVILFIMIFTLFSIIFSDWEHFKLGLFGNF